MATLISPPSALDPHSNPARPDHPSIDPAAVHQVLEDVLASQPFCHTQQCQNLLRYIIKHSLTQQDHLLRERVIGAEVFGRRPDYDTGEDPVVRIRAAEVRKRLAQFYQSTAAAPAPPDVHIEIPSGSYRANFRWRDGARAAHETPAPSSPHSANLFPSQPTETPPDPPALAPSLKPYLHPHSARPIVSTISLRWIVIAAAVVAAIVACIFVAGKIAVPTQQREFRAFWQPWISSPKPVIISIGSNAVYRVSGQLTARYAHEHNLESFGEEVYIPTGPQSEITSSDLVPAFNSFVALSDVGAVSNLVASLTRQQHAFQLRFPDDISFAELRNSPTVLVGGFNNPMTVELTKNLPFVLRAGNQIDETPPPARHWTLHAPWDSHDTEDYAIITRIAQRNGDAPIISVAGMGGYGTLAAAQFICDPASIVALARKLPRNWSEHNQQLVLHVHVVDFKPASTEIVALRTW